MRPGRIRIRRVYPHPRALVWRCLTDAELLGEWLMPNDFEPAVGHRFTFQTDPAPGFDGIVRCEVLTLESEKMLAFSWRGGPLDTVVRFELTDAVGGTALTVVHDGFRGLQGRLVQRILQLGSRDLYGRQLPALLDRLHHGADPSPTPHGPEAEKGVIVWLLEKLHRKGHQ